MFSGSKFSDVPPSPWSVVLNSGLPFTPLISSQNQYYGYGCFAELQVSRGATPDQDTRLAARSTPLPTRRT